MSVYRCSPEHKTHPGSWGAPQWHPRTPAISPCPTGIRSDTVPQGWLLKALPHSGFWDPVQGDKYVYWYESTYDLFFVARRTREATLGQPAEYKGYPVADHEVPAEVADFCLERSVIREAVHQRLRRARRRLPEER
jgi:hypothetical protein